MLAAGTLGFVFLLPEGGAGLMLAVILAGLVGGTVAPVLLVASRKRYWVCPRRGTVEEARRNRPGSG